MENVGTCGLFYEHLVDFVAIWYVLWSFGKFFPFWNVVQKKIWQPWRFRPRAVAASSVTGFAEILPFGEIYTAKLTRSRTHFGYIFGQIKSKSQIKLIFSETIVKRGDCCLFLVDFDDDATCFWSHWPPRNVLCNATLKKRGYAQSSTDASGDRF
jgi:hypothetical protein